MDWIAPPSDEKELLERARRLAGRRLGDLAKERGGILPEDLARQKGRVGMVIERLLGADAGVAPCPDFRGLGIELKTLPIDARGKIKETTFVCSASISHMQNETWLNSRVRKKLACVLWVPVEATSSLSLAERRVGSAVLWRPDEEEENVLRRDWEDLSDILCRGFADSISARRGHVLQIRPKARHAGVRQSLIPTGADCVEEAIESLPRGFYLRRQFTERILSRALAMPGTYVAG